MFKMKSYLALTIGLCVAVLVMELPVLVPNANAAVARLAGAGTKAGKPVKPLAETLSGTAATSYEAGKLLFEAGDFAGALLKFRSAFELQGDPRLLWNMAACERSLRHYRAVRELTLQYLQRAGVAGLVSKSDRAAAESLLGTLQTLIGKVRLTVSEPNTVLSVDGEEVGVSPLQQEIEVDIGTRTFSGKKMGFRTFSVLRDVAANASIFIEMTMEPTIAKLQISAVPSEGAISVDGKVVGNGQWAGSIAPGKHYVAVTAPSYIQFKADITLEDRENRELTARLDKVPGSSRVVWVLAGVAVVAAGAVGSYFLFKPREPTLVEGDRPSVFLPLLSGNSQ